MSKDCFSHPCSQHNQQIVNICGAPRCLHRVLCQICLESHQKSHQTFLKPIKEAWTNFEIDTEYENISNLITQRTHYYSTWVEELYNTLGRLTLMITKTVEDVKSDVEREAQKTHNVLIDELKFNKESLKTIKKECADMGCVDGSNLRDRYADLYAAFISKNYEFNKSLQVQDVQRQAFTLTLNKILDDTKNAFTVLKKNVNNSLRDFSLMDLKIKNLINNYHYGDALTLASESQAIKKDIFAPNSMEVAKSYRILGKILQKMQHNTHARLNLSKSIELVAKNIPADDPFLAEGHQLIAECFLNERILGRSYNTLLKAQSIYQSKGGSDNPALVGVNILLAQIFIRQSSFCKALELLEATEKSALHHFGAESEQMASILLYKTMALEKLGKAKGPESFEPAINLHRNLFGEKSIEVTQCYEVVARIAKEEERSEWIDKALKILAEIFPNEKDPRIGILYSVKSSLLSNTDFEEAQKLAERGVKIVLEEVGRDSSHAAIANEYLSKLWSTKDKLKGLYYVKEALNIVQHIYNHHNSRSVYYTERMADVAIINQNANSIKKYLEEALGSRRVIYKQVEFRLAEGFFMYPEIRPESSQLYLTEFNEGVKSILAGLKREFALTIDSPAFVTMATLCCSDENYLKALAAFKEDFSKFKEEAGKTASFVNLVLEKLNYNLQNKQYSGESFEKFLGIVAIFAI